MELGEVTYFASSSDFRSWFETHHDREDALWVGFWKKATGRPSITWPESVDVALCFGWIDGIRKRIDDEAYAIRFTPRRRGSTWSLRNMDRYAVLAAEGRIAPAGRAAYARRKEAKTGIYAFEQTGPPELSPDFRDRLRANDVAWADWEARPPGYRKKITHWVMSAKRPETRDRRLQKLIDDLTAGLG